MIKQELLILLIEDSLADTYLVKANLNRVLSTSTIYSIHHCDSIESALDWLRENKPDCILLDLTLPRIGGIDTYRAVRLGAQGVPVLILTGIYDRDLASQAVEEGAGWYMLKSAIRPDTIDLNIQLAIHVTKLNLLRVQGDAVRQLAADTQAGVFDNFSLIKCCSVCKKVRDESIIVEEDPSKKWITIWDYLEKNAVGISHTYCPTCMPEQISKAVK